MAYKDEGGCMKAYFPNYKYSLVNLAGSIMKEFGLEGFYPSNRSLDKILKYNYSNVIVIVYDGLGANEADVFIKENTFLGKHRLKNLSSVFPSTKDVTLNALTVGKLFSNNNEESIITRINKQNEHHAYGIFPEGLGSYKNRDEMYKRIINLCDGNSKKYIYAYCDDYDLTTLDAEIEALTDNIVDSIVFVVSNRGEYFDELIETDLNLYPKFLDTLNDYKLIEGRFLLVSVENEEKFLEEFNHYFTKGFRLLKKEEALEKLILDNDEFYSYAYDYIIVGRENIYFKNDNGLKYGGISENEMLVPLFNVCRKKKDDQVVIRRVKYEDYEDFAKLANQFHGNRAANRKDIFQKTSASFSRPDFYNLCNSFAGKLIYVYVLSEKIIGYVKFDLDDHRGSRTYTDKCALRIYELYVLEEFRRQGVAKSLYEEVLKYAKRVRADRIEFLVWDFEEETKQFVDSLQMKVQSYCYEIRL